MEFLNLNFLKLNTIFNFNYFNFVHSINELTIDDKILKLIKTITIYGINLNIIIEFILKKIKINGIYDTSINKTLYTKDIINKIDINSQKSNSLIHEWIYIDTFKYKNINSFNPSSGFIIYGDNLDTKHYKTKKIIGKLNNNNIFLLLK